MAIETLKRGNRDGRPTNGDWLPLGVLVPLAMVLGRWLPAWAWMWTLAVAVYAGCKWLTLARVRREEGMTRLSGRAWCYLLGWPGMDARRFLLGANCPERPLAKAWLWAGVKTLFGAVLLWGAARCAGGRLLAGWIGMTGIIFLLHFGAFELVALFWQRKGIDAPPLMRAPVLSASLGEFWGRRWNSGFRDLAFGTGFDRLKRRVGARWATLLVFVVSGVVHDLVISVPARGGYGLPTAYFAVQGVCLLAEHVRGAALARWRGRWPGRVWTWLVVAGPAFFLFHPAFVRRVILPFMQTIYAL